MKNEDIVIFSSDDWGWKTSKYHLSIRFAKDNRVLFVSSIGFRAPKASSQDLWRIFHKLISFFKGLKRVNDNLFVMTPLVAPFAWFPYREAFNRWFLVFQITLARRWLGIRAPYVFVFSQNWYHFVRDMPRKKLIYYCVDEHSGFAGVDELNLTELDKGMIKLANVIFCSARILCEKNKEENPNTHYMPHGVHYDLFASTLSDVVQVAPEIVRLRNPVVLFFGHISYDWIDTDLAKYIASEKPDWSFAYVGRYSMAKDEFKGYPNIYLLGEQAFERLPSFCKGADMAIIPFVYSDLTKNCNPLKLREYIAAGLSVVSTDIPEVRSFGDMVYVGRNKEEFLQALERAFEERNPERNRLLSLAMNKESWDQRVKEIFDIIKR